MLVSLNWLKEFVDTDKNAEGIADILTMGGMEVEAITHLGKTLSQIQIAKIVEVTAHPHDAKLHVTKIDLGDRKVSVVCGAPNVAPGQITAFAGLGVKLPSGISIEERQIKGIPSPGMLCSEKELSIGDDESGILVFDEDLPLGKPLSSALPYLEDYILETSVTPNRGDCLSILGVAREVAALLDIEWKKPVFQIHESNTDINHKIRIELPDPDLCLRYVARLVEGVSLGKSSLEARIKLLRAGVRPISNVVDVTNLVLLECGQPLHAFDYELLEDQKIVVKRSRPGDLFTTLDGIERTLPNDSLMIMDGRRSVALAGIMGGANSEINDSTQNVLIESACFEPFGIRRTSKSLGLSTEASYRFERGVDPEGSLWAASRCAFLMQKYARGAIARGVADSYPSPIVRKPVSVRSHKVNTLLGTKLETAEIAGLLERLNIDTEQSRPEDAIMCSPPSWRWDLDREVDMAEEVARMMGIQNISVTMPKLNTAPDHTRQRHDMVRKSAELMDTSGFTEIITMSFISSEAFREFDLSSSEGFALMNPLSEDAVVMRSSLVPGLLTVMKRNANFRNDNLKLYEIGRTFTPINGADLPQEDLKLSFLAVGSRNPFLWNLPKDELIDFYDAKGALETLLEGFDILDVEYVPSEKAFLHPGKSADVWVNDRNIGYLGELSPINARRHELDQAVYICEVMLEPIFAKAHGERVFRAIPRYPYIERDLSIIVEEKVSGAMIKRLISHLGRDIISSVNLFDLYRGESIPKGRQSMAFRIRYQSENRTLTDEEVQEIHSHILEALSTQFGASTRE